MNNTILEINNLKTYFNLDEGTLKAVDGVSFAVGEKETLGIIGESGCGKSVTAQSILRIVPPPGNIVARDIFLSAGRPEPLNLTGLHPYGKEIRDIRGKEISMIFQEPMTSLSPVHTIGAQIAEAILLHKTQEKKEARKLAIDSSRRPQYDCQ